MQSLIQRVPARAAYADLLRAFGGAPWYRAAPTLLVRLSEEGLDLTAVGARFARYYDRRARTYVDVPLGAYLNDGARAPAEC